MSLGPIHVIRQKNICSAAVIFLHGSGDTGQGVLDWLKFLVGDFALPHIKFYFPTAPLIPYTPSNGELSNVWFDRYDITPEVPEHEESLNVISQEMQGLIKTIRKDDNLPLHKIVVGGFSMGGALALHTAYRFSPGLAGAFTLSSFLNTDSAVYKQGQAFDTPLFMCHGDRDTMVPLSWGHKTHENLKKLGIDAEFHVIKNTMHEMKKHEILNLFQWIQKILSEKRQTDSQ